MTSTLCDLLSGQNPTFDEMNRLIAEGANINELSADRRTPLMCACLNEHSSAHAELTKCIEKLYELNAASIRYNNALHLISMSANPNMEAFHMILNKSPYKQNSISNDAKTPLMLACKHDNIACVKALLAAGAKIELGKFSSLTEFTENSSREIFHLLLDAGADINFVSGDKGSILEYFIREECEYFILELIKRNVVVHCEHVIITLDLDLSSSVIEALLSIMNDYDDVLEFAYRIKNVNMINLLLDRNLTVKNPLHDLLSSYNCDIDIRSIIRRLVALGVDINEKAIPEFLDFNEALNLRKDPTSITPKSPLHLACKNNLSNAATELIRLDANYDSDIDYSAIDSQIQRSLSLNYSQYPSTVFTLLDTKTLRNSTYQTIFILMLCRNLPDNVFNSLPIELMEYIFSFIVDNARI